MRNQITFFRTAALLFLIMLGNISVMALSFEYGALSYSTTRNGVFVDGFAKNATIPSTLTIPDEVTYQGTTYPVEQVGISGLNTALGALSGKSAIKKVVIGSNVETLGAMCFMSCTNLTSVDMTRASRLETIETMAFYGCPITTLTLPDNISLENIGLGAFVYSGNNVGKITKLTLGLTGSYCAEPMSIFGNAVKLIKFKGHNNIGGGWGKLPLVEVNFAEASQIGEGTFADCTTLTRVTGLVGADIKARAFANTGLTDVNIEYSKVDTTAFINCKELTTLHLKDMRRDGWSFAGNPVIQKIYLTDCGVIPAEAFRGCYNLTDVIEASKVTLIDKYAFAECSSLTKADFSNVQYINEGAFKGCTSLDDFSNMNKSLTKVESRAFENCTTLNGYIDLSKCNELGEYIFNNAGTEDLHITLSLNPCLKNTLSGCRAGYLTCNDTRLYNNYEARNNQSPLNGSMIQNVFLPNLTAALPEYLFYNMPALRLVSADKLESADNLTKNFTYCPAFTNLDINNSTKLYSELMDAGVYSKDRTILYYVLPNATYYKADAKTKKVYADCADQYLWGSIGSKLGVLDLSNTMLLSEDEVVLFNNPKSTTTRPCSYARIPYGKRNKYKTFAAAGMEFITEYIKGDVNEDASVTNADAQGVYIEMDNAE